MNESENSEKAKKQKSSLLRFAPVRGHHMIHTWSVLDIALDEEQEREG